MCRMWRRGGDLGARVGGMYGMGKGEKLAGNGRGSVGGGGGEAEMIKEVGESQKGRGGGR